MERKQKKRRKVEKEERIRGRSSETGAKTEFAITLSMAEEANAFSAGDNSACSDGRGGENKCSDSEGTKTEDGSS